MEVTADVIAILLSWKIITVTVASGVAEKTAAAGLFVEIGTQYIGITTTLLLRFAADLYNQCETAVQQII